MRENLIKQDPKPEYIKEKSYSNILNLLLDCFVYAMFSQNHIGVKD